MHACSFRDCMLEKNGVEEAGLKSIMLGGGYWRLRLRE